MYFFQCLQVIKPGLCVNILEFVNILITEFQMSFVSSVGIDIDNSEKVHSKKILILFFQILTQKNILDLNFLINKDYFWATSKDKTYFEVLNFKSKINN